MDIKDLIIIAGSIFFVLIVAHGLWVARRNRQNEIRMDIKASDTKDDAPSDLSLSPDFPNGGARLIRHALEEGDVETVSHAKRSDPPEQSHEALMTIVDDQHQHPSGRD